MCQKSIEGEYDQEMVKKVNVNLAPKSSIDNTEQYELESNKGKLKILNTTQNQARLQPFRISSYQKKIEVYNSEKLDKNFKNSQQSKKKLF